MFNLNSRLQVAALCFLAIILYDYFKNRKLPLLSTKFFSLLLFFASLNIVADISTVFLCICTRQESEETQTGPYDVSFITLYDSNAYGRFWST